LLEERAALAIMPGQRMLPSHGKYNLATLYPNLPNLDMQVTEKAPKEIFTTDIFKFGDRLTI